MSLSRVLGVCAASAIAVAVGVACGSSGGVKAGGSCYVATDCVAGLICEGVTMTQSGTCTSNLNKVEPPADASVQDGGDLEGGVPGTDATPSEDGAIPTDTGAGEETGPVDSGAKDTGGGA